ncbi:MAG: phage head-tail connector protein [Mesorhizobium sp.]|mgnify:CR=1 FL=1|nr:head-tail connector protein [Mesorhizobium sp.]MBN9244185.1 phage head-tail connector protein [Mesorhizobium sp.]
MTLIRTVDPGAEPVTLAEAKAHLRIDHGDDDDLLAGLIRAARQEVERSTGIALLAQSWRLVLDDWPQTGCTLVRIYPLIEIQAVTAFGSEGEGSVVDPATYQIDTVSRPARIHFTAPVAPLRAMNGLEIDFTAGFGEAGTDVPDPLKRAILLLVAHWYEFRAGYGPADQPVSYPAGFDRIVAGYRAGRL